MATDRELLSRYGSHGDESAFTEVVQRHLPHVFATALRLTRDHALAQDVAQVVFHDLARKSARLHSETVLAAWLHRATCFAARDALRRRLRQAQREQKAHLMDSIERQHSEPSWDEIQPWLDHALDELSAEDRDALCARFLQQRSLPEVAETLGTTPDAARKRIERALDRLRTLLARRGVHTTAAALGNAVLAHAVPPLPPALGAFAASVSSAAMAGSASTVPVLMSSTSLKPAAILFAAALVVGVPIALQESAIAKARDIVQRIPPSDQPPTDTSRPPRQAVARPDLADESRRLETQNADLRRRLAELAARLASVSHGAPASSVLLGNRHSIASLAEAGLATPEAALQSHLAAMRRGDTNRLAQTWVWPKDTPPELLDIHLRASSSSNPKGLAADFRAGTIADLILLRSEDAGDGDRWLAYQLILSNGTPGPPYQVRMRLLDGQWRIVLQRTADIDQHPLTP